MRIEVMLKDVCVGENGAKTWVVWKSSLACLKPKVWKMHLWIIRSCWGKHIKLGLAAKTWTHKKNPSCKFSKSFAKKCLNQICVSLCPIALWQSSKMKHHWANKINKCQVATS